MRTFPLLLLWASACSDYKLNPAGGEAGGGDTGGAPDVVVDPGSVSLDGHCDSDSAVVEISNEGTADLTVLTLAVSGAAWTLDAPDLPLVLAAGEATSVTATGTDGDGTLTVGTDDPDQPEILVPLSALADVPPTLILTGPTASSTLAEGATVSLQATVADDTDAPETMDLVWASDVDGALGSATIASDGTSTLSWDGSSRSPGDHVLSATLVDSCGHEVTETMPVCHQGSSTYTSIDFASWNYEGDAAWDTTNNWVSLTGIGAYEVGSAFDITTETSGTEVSIEFDFYMGGGSGADGFAVTALDLDRATSYLASAGGCLGYGYSSGCDELADPLPGWTVEVDTYTNSWDPTSEDHVAFMFDGDVNTVEAWAPVPDMEDATWHRMVVDVSDPHVTVSIDGVVYIDQDFTGTFDFPAHVGFSAATGSLTNHHLIDALEVTELACEE